MDYRLSLFVTLLDFEEKKENLYKSKQLVRLWKMYNKENTDGILTIAVCHLFGL